MAVVWNKEKSYRYDDLLNMFQFRYLTVAEEFEFRITKDVKSIKDAEKERNERFYQRHKDDLF